MLEPVIKPPNIKGVDPSKRGGRGRGIWLGLGAVLLVVVIGICVYLLYDNDP